ncbi:MAG: SMC-Scp complex subunit ScpB [Longimonas sp.]|uniref:SMC-Scp complex subunit ScpB n=1 Tax=Longimonas sp. TaxID=2039626 RepID=UPI0039762572
MTNSDPALGFGVSPRLLKATEALLFAADDPIGAERIAEIVTEVTGETKVDAERVETVIEALQEAYNTNERAFEIVAWAGGYRMVTREEVAPFVKAMVQDEQRQSLSRSLLETVAVVAYKQPVTRPEVDFVRGVNSDYALRKLMELELVDVKGRSESLGRPLLYGTTPEFLEQFGLNTLDDLPTIREVEELLDDPNFDDERAQLLQLKTEEAADALGDAMPDSLQKIAEAEANDADAAPSEDEPNPSEQSDTSVSSQ